jgi:hypothetical protein
MQSTLHVKSHMGSSLGSCVKLVFAQIAVEVLDATVKKKRIYFFSVCLKSKSVYFLSDPIVTETRIKEIGIILRVKIEGYKGFEHEFLDATSNLTVLHFFYRF